MINLPFNRVRAGLSKKKMKSRLVNATTDFPSLYLSRHGQGALNFSVFSKISLFHLFVLLDDSR